MTVFRDIHRTLRIHSGYFLSDSPDAPSISEFERDRAIRQLRAAGEFNGLDTVDGILGLLAKKLNKLALPAIKETSIRKSRHRQSSASRPTTENNRLARKRAIMAALIEDPKASVARLARLFQADESTVRAYRRQLRDERKIA